MVTVTPPTHRPITTTAVTTSPTVPCETRVYHRGQTPWKDSHPMLNASSNPSPANALSSTATSPAYVPPPSTPFHTSPTHSPTDSAGGVGKGTVDQGVRYDPTVTRGAGRVAVDDLFCAVPGAQGEGAGTASCQGSCAGCDCQEADSQAECARLAGRRARG